MGEISIAVEKAVQDVLSENGGILTGFVGLISFIDKNGVRTYAPYSGDDQGILVTLGMVDALRIHIHKEFGDG